MTQKKSPPDNEPLSERLRQVPLFCHLSAEELQCLTSGTKVEFKAGAQIARQGDPPDGFYVILSGITDWTRKVGQQEVHAVTLETGDVFAELILLLDEPYPTSGRAVTDVCLYKLEPEDFWEMLRLCPKILRDILKISAERSQIHESVTQQQAKLMSLGTLSAGLAHELNNPAAAVRRGINHLEENWQKLSALALDQQPLTAAQTEFLEQLSQRSPNLSQLNPIEQSELEDAVIDWLEEKNIAHGWQLAPTLVAAGVDRAELEKIAQMAPDLNSVLVWIEASLIGTELLRETKLGAARISEIVAAMKDYSYMDRAPLQMVDIHEGLEKTLTILSHKLKEAKIIKEYGQLPRICAYGSQLNQVWTNLIDNALQAIGGRGRIWIRTALEGDRILVEIADNGTGISSEIAPRIYEQFFTTKAVGEGLGLGLDTVRRIVVGHQGNIRFDSEPGNTRFQVRLPLDQ
ncbi:MAG: ATP-binding protein [Cyanophyceae cyanobacterium]